MQVLNASNASISFPLDNRSLLTVLPNDVSISFPGTATVLRRIVTLGSPTKIGIIIQSSFEYDKLQEVTGALPYVYNSVEEAKLKLIDGKEPEPEKMAEGPNNVEIAKLKEQLVEKAALITEKEAEIASLKDQLQNAPIEKYKEELQNLTNEYKELKGKYDELVANTKGSSDELFDLKRRFEALQKEYQGVLKVNTDLDTALKSAKEDGGRLAEVEAENVLLKGDINKLSEENKTLKEEGAKLLDNYTKMKGALMDLCNKSGYKMVDGQWVKSE